MKPWPLVLQSTGQQQVVVRDVSLIHHRHVLLLSADRAYANADFVTTVVNSLRNCLGPSRVTSVPVDRFNPLTVNSKRDSGSDTRCQAVRKSYVLYRTSLRGRSLQVSLEYHSTTTTTYFGNRGSQTSRRLTKIYIFEGNLQFDYNVKGLCSLWIDNTY